MTRAVRSVAVGVGAPGLESCGAVGTGSACEQHEMLDKTSKIFRSCKNDRSVPPSKAHDTDPNPNRDLRSRVKYILTEAISQHEQNLVAPPVWRSPLWDFTRVFKSKLPDADPEELFALISEEMDLRGGWFDVLNGTLEPLGFEDELVEEFVGCWERIRYLDGHDLLMHAAEAADRCPLPHRRTLLYTRFLSVCHYLQILREDLEIIVPEQLFAKLLGCSTMTVSRMRQRAVKSGLLTLVKTHNRQARLAATFRFNASMAMSAEMTTNADSISTSPADGTPSTGSPGIVETASGAASYVVVEDPTADGFTVDGSTVDGKPDATKYLQAVSTKKTKSLSCDAAGPPNWDLDFETFWSSYPKKKGKKAAKQKWLATLRRGDVTVEALVTAAKAYSELCTREEREERYIMHGSTFLGPSEHWRDYAPSQEEENRKKKRAELRALWEERKKAGASKEELEAIQAEADCRH